MQQLGIGHVELDFKETVAQGLFAIVFHVPNQPRILISGLRRFPFFRFREDIRKSPASAVSETTLMEHQRCQRQRQDGIITARDSGKSAFALWETARSRQRWVKPLILFKKTPLKKHKTRT